MNRLLKISGIIAWIVLLYQFRSSIPILAISYGKIFLMIVGICSLIYFIAKLSKSNTFKSINNIIAGKSLTSAINNFVENLPNPGSKLTSDLITQLVIRFTRVGLIAVFAALIPTILLYKQNNLLEQQNYRLKQQTYLQEAERRSSLIFLFSNIMSSIDEELKDDYLSNGIRDLSPQLMGRIISISSRLKPYKFLENGELLEKEISPERGQLLTTLLASNLHESILHELLNKSDFSYSDLKGSNLSRTDMSYLNLNHSNLEGANLTSTEMNGGNCQYCNLKNVKLMRSDVTENNFKGSDFSGSDLRSLNAYNTWFTDCNLSNTKLLETKFTYSFLENVILENAIIHKTFFNQFISSQGEDSIVGRKRVLETYKIDSSLVKHQIRGKSDKIEYYITKR